MSDSERADTKFIKNSLVYWQRSISRAQYAEKFRVSYWL